MAESPKYEQVEGGKNTGVHFYPYNIRCDICGEVEPDEYVDGRTKQGLWANMCMKCYRRHGVGLGVGRGQKYKKVVGTEQ